MHSVSLLWAIAIIPELFILRLGQRRLFWDTERVLPHRWITYLVAMPGTAAHELSHAAMAIMLRVPVGKIVLFRPVRDPKTNSITLGYVETAQTDPLRGALVSIAPVIIIPLMLVGISFLTLGTLNPLDIDWSAVPIWRLAIWLLCGATFSMAAFPSIGDHIGILGGISLLVLFGGGAYWLWTAGSLPQAIQLVGTTLLLPSVWAVLLIAVFSKLPAKQLPPAPDER